MEEIIEKLRSEIAVMRGEYSINRVRQNELAKFYGIFNETSSVVESTEMKEYIELWQKNDIKLRRILWMERAIAALEHIDNQNL